MPAFREKFSLRASAAALGAAALLAVSGAPARAQFFPFWGAPPQAVNLMPAPLIYRQLRARGYEVVAPLERNGGVYLADVRNRLGGRRRLVIDAYSGAILQTFAYGPPRPPAAIPESRAYPPGPAYASRFAPEELPRSETHGFAPAPYAPSREVPFRRPPHKVVRREITPDKTAHAPEPPHSVAATHGSEPATKAASVPPRGGEALMPVAHVAPPKEAAHREAEAAAAPPPVAKPVAVKAPSKPVTGPGYANGVPINPLD